MKLNIRKDLILYLFSSLFSYSGLFVYYTLTGGTRFDNRMIWALFCSTVAWVFLVGPQIVVQWIILKWIRKINQCSLVNIWMTSNCVVISFIILLVGSGYINSRPKALFENAFDIPVPKSFRILEQGRYIAFDSELIVFHCNIVNNDILQYVNNNKYVLLKEQVDFVRWRKRIESMTGINIYISSDYQAYQRKERLLFYNSGKSDAVFILDSH